MKVALLWFDNNPHRDLKEKITRAARHYCRKFGIAPNACYVHKSALSDNGSTTLTTSGSTTLTTSGSTTLTTGAKTAQVGQIQVTPKPFILPHHIQIGQEEQP